MKTKELYTKKEVRKFHLEAILNKLKSINLPTEVLDEVYYHILRAQKPW